MATAEAVSNVEVIGQTAGSIWHLLFDEGQPISLSQLVKRSDQPRDVVMQAVGWLARENKITIEENGRGRFVWLSE